MSTNSIRHIQTTPIAPSTPAPIQPTAAGEVLVYHRYAATQPPATSAATPKNDPLPLLILGVLAIVVAVGIGAAIGRNWQNSQLSVLQVENAQQQAAIDAARGVLCR